MKHSKSQVQLLWLGKNIPKIIPAVENSPRKWSNRLILGDNRDVMIDLLKEGSGGQVNLIYIDPPFGIGSDRHLAQDGDSTNQRAYTDSGYSGFAGYLQMLGERFVLMKELLAEDGSIYVHLDDHVVHYVRVMLDELFGRDNFVNQIIWQRTGAHNDPLAYGRNYDVILFYQKSANRTWNKPLAAYDSVHQKRYFQQDSKGRWFRLNNPTGKGYQDHTRDFGRGPMKPPRDRHWSVSQRRVNEWLTEGRIVYTSNGYPFVKRYLDEMPGKPVQSLWTDLIPPRSSRELTGYPTQKPEKLLARIIQASSNPGDIVADFYCGSGTTLVVAEKLGRLWLGCDSSELAIKIAKERMVRGGKKNQPLIIKNGP